MSMLILKDEWKLVKAENQRQQKDWGGVEMGRVLGRRKVYARNGGLGDWGVRCAGGRRGWLCVPKTLSVGSEGRPEWGAEPDPVKNQRLYWGMWCAQNSGKGEWYNPAIKQEILWPLGRLLMDIKPQKPVWVHTQEISNNAPHLTISGASCHCIRLSTFAFSSQFRLKLWHRLGIYVLRSAFQDLCGYLSHG